MTLQGAQIELEAVDLAHQLQLLCLLSTRHPHLQRLRSRSGRLRPRIYTWTSVLPSTKDSTTPTTMTATPARSAVLARLEATATAESSSS